jgi:cytochrome bd ubiquinol oxidase subunit I
MGDLLSLARMQFGVTSIYHFLFVPLTLGLSFLIAVMESLYVIKGDEGYKKMTKFWGKLFLINFTLGVVTGIVQEFHFGMSWSEFSRFIGDVLGAPLAIEALAAFFMESVFLGIWIFGWDKISKKLHLAVIWLVTLAGTLSAFWILVVNTFMQEPSGYMIKNGKAQMTDFFSLITSEHLWLQFPHMLMSGFVTGSIFVIGISSYHLLKKNCTDFFKKSLKIALTIGVVSLVLIIVFGDLHGKYLVEAQPMKMAATEAHWNSEAPAPFNIMAIVDEINHKNTFSIQIPKLLSFLDYSNFTQKVDGINDIQAQYEKELGAGNYIPPVTVVFYSFRVMVGAGMLMLLAVMLAIFLFWKGRLENNNLFLKFLVLILPLPYICNTAGWIVTEIGRQPWVVHKLLKVDDAVSKSVSPSFMVISLFGFLIIYGILAVVDIYLLAKFAKIGPVEETTELKQKKDSKGESLWV